MRGSPEDPGAGASSGVTAGLVAPPTTPRERLPEGLPGGFLGACSEVVLRALFFYPGVTVLGLAAAGACEGWRVALVASAAAAGLGLVGGALWARGETLAEGVGEVASPLEDPETGPTLFSGLFGWLRWFVEGVVSALAEVVAGDGEGCLATLLGFGLALALFGALAFGGLLALPLVAFAWSPSWARAALVLAPPLPLTGLFAVGYAWRLRAWMRARDEWVRFDQQREFARLEEGRAGDDALPREGASPPPDCPQS